MQPLALTATRMPLVEDVFQRTPESPPERDAPVSAAQELGMFADPSQAYLSFRRDILTVPTAFVSALYLC